MLICIDFDGVIADSLSQQLDIVRRAQERLAFGRVPLLEDFRVCENLSYSGFGELIGISAAEMPLWKAEIEKELMAMPDAPFFSGIEGALERLTKRAGLAIITSNLTDVVERGFQKHGLPLPKVYDLSYSLDKTLKIIAAARDHGEGLETTLMVGDTRSDIRHGRDAGVRTVATTWGYQSRETLALEMPSYFADSPGELAALLESLPLRRGDGM